MRLRKVAAPQPHLRSAVYAGAVLHFSAPVASEALRAAVLEEVHAATDNIKPRSLHRMYTQADMMKIIGHAQSNVRNSDAIWRRALDVVRYSGLDLDALAVDRVRLRAITPDGHERPEAQGAYAVHRDTWYANPQCQLNWWMPLFEVSADDSFRIYAAHFAAPIRNSSKTFDYARWVTRFGWQDKAAPLTAYPAALDTPDATDAFDVAVGAGDVVVFSAAHLHGTRPNRTATLRWSIDFRVVHRGDNDHGHGAPNVDNASTGSALVEYRDATVGIVRS